MSVNRWREGGEKGMQEKENEKKGKGGNERVLEATLVSVCVPLPSPNTFY